MVSIGKLNPTEYGIDRKRTCSISVISVPYWTERSDNACKFYLNYLKEMNYHGSDIVSKSTIFQDNRKLQLFFKHENQLISGYAAR